MIGWIYNGNVRFPLEFWVTVYKQKWSVIFPVMKFFPKIFQDKGMETWFFPVYRKGYFSSFYSVNQKSFSFHKILVSICKPENFGFYFVNQKISSEIILEFSFMDQKFAWSICFQNEFIFRNYVNSSNKRLRQR